MEQHTFRSSLAKAFLHHPLQYTIPLSRPLRFLSLPESVRRSIYAEVWQWGHYGNIIEPLYMTFRLLARCAIFKIDEIRAKDLAPFLLSIVLRLSPLRRDCPLENAMLFWIKHRPPFYDMTRKYTLSAWPDLLLPTHDPPDALGRIRYDPTILQGEVLYHPPPPPSAAQEAWIRRLSSLLNVICRRLQNSGGDYGATRHRDTASVDAEVQAKWLRKEHVVFMRQYSHETNAKSRPVREDYLEGMDRLERHLDPDVGETCIRRPRPRQQRIGFLDLPYEVRRVVYAHLEWRRTPQRPRGDRTWYDAGQRWRHIVPLDKFRPPAILQLDRVLQVEGEYAFDVVRVGVFLWRSYSLEVPYLKSLDEETVRLLRRPVSIKGAILQFRHLHVAGPKNFAIDLDMVGSTPKVVVRKSDRFDKALARQHEAVETLERGVHHDDDCHGELERQVQASIDGRCGQGFSLQEIEMIADYGLKIIHEFR